MIQSHYIPWAGFFDLIGGCSDVVILDSVAYSKNSYFNRNQLRGTKERFWLTIPVMSSGRSSQLISEIQVANHHWIRKHLRSIEQALHSAPHFNDCINEWSRAYEKSRDCHSLSDINRIWLDCTLKQLGMNLTIHTDRDFRVSSLEKSERLVELCRMTETSVYRTGPRGLSYLNLQKFEDAEITVEVIQYADYYSYLGTEARVAGPVSIIENLAYLGAETVQTLLHEYVGVNSLRSDPLT